MIHPLVSIIIPTFNRAKLLKDTLESVIQQSYKNWECIVIDDGSKDNSIALLKGFAENDDRIKYYIRPEKIRKGASSCRNYALNKIRGSFVQYLDSDDIIHEHKIQKQIEKINNQTICTCKWGYFSHGELFSRLKYKQRCYRNFNRPVRLLYYFGNYNEFLPLHAYLIPREIINKTGFWKENLGNNDDAEYISRILVNARKVKFIKDAVVFYRVEGFSTLSGFNTLENAESAILSLKYISDNLSDFPNTRRKYLDNLKKIIRNKIQDVFPQLYEKNQELLS